MACRYLPVLLGEGTYYRRAHILHETEFYNCIQVLSQSIRVTKEIAHSASVLSFCLVLTVEQLLS
jgi:hypothetical protein